MLEIFYVGSSVRTSEVCRLTQKLAWVQWTLWRDKVRRLRRLKIYKILVNLLSLTVVGDRTTDQWRDPCLLPSLP